MNTRSSARFASALAACAALSLVALAPAAHAQTAYIGTTDTTLDASNPLTGSAVVGYASENDFIRGTNPTSPTVALVSGGIVNGFLDVYNSSTINISGGNVDGDLYAFNSSTVNISGGSVGGSLVAINGSTINFSGGGIVNILEANDSGTLNLFDTGLTTTLVDDNAKGYNLYRLSGTLSDGTALVNQALFVQNGVTAHFTLNNTPTAVPEPGSVALLVGLTTVGANLLRKRQARK